MASSGKFDLSSSSPDRPLYNSGQRGSYSAALMERSTSFRENMENPILSSLPSMSRSTLTVSRGDVNNFLQCLRFDPKSMAAKYKHSRHGDFKRLANAALGAPDDSPSGSLKVKFPSSSPEDLKRMKVGLRESAIKARERVKIFSEVLSVIDKCFPSIPSRKRSRPDAFSGDRSNGLLTDRTIIGATVGKMGTQSHAIISAFDFEQQKVEERGKNPIPNKRTRTSMVDQRADVRPNTPARSSGAMDSDKEVPRLPNSNALLGEDRALPMVADGWEKSKMKKKRSGIKADAAPSPSSVSAKPVDGCREPKQGMHPRNLPDGRSRLHDSHGFRPGAANGAVGAGKAALTSQQASIGIRSSIPRPEQENTSLLHDKKEQTTNSEQERTNLKALNKASVREEFFSGSPSSNAKLHARGPRSGSGVVPKLSPVVQRATASSGWESSHGTSKNPGAVGSTNRKRTLSTRSSSPPVAQWADRRPQKISRTARRTNLVPIVTSNDEVPPLGTNGATVSEKGRGFARRFPANSAKQFKSKGDHLLSSTLSESEESGAADLRPRDKGKKSDEMEEKSGPNVQKMSTLVPPTRKNKLVNEDDLVDGVRRQGRPGRGFASARSVTLMSSEKLRNVGTPKQLRTARLGFDKPESRSGRPPTRKLSDRKAYTRQKHYAVNVATDFLDDGQGELLAAAKAVLNPSFALSSPFWRQMDKLFGFLSDADLSYIKQEGNIQSTVATSNPIDSCDTLPNRPWAVRPPKSGTESRYGELISEHLTPDTVGPCRISLCQSLLAALISEEENDESTWSENDDLGYNVYGSSFELETDVESKALNQWSFKNFELGGSGTSDGYRINSTLRSCKEMVHGLTDNHVTSIPYSAFATGFDHSHEGLLSDSSVIPSITCSEYQYGNMPIDERLLLEIQSLGLYPARVPDLVNPGDEDVSGDISRLEEKHREQVFKKKSLLDKLLKSTEEARELHEKEFEWLSLDKLTRMAYQKYMSCWAPGAPGGKSASGKMAKQAALDFVKRTLERCHEFEATGKSCFAEPLYREMFITGSSHYNDPQADTLIDNEPMKLYGNSTEKASGAQLSPSLNNHEIYPSDGKDDVWSSRVKKRELYLDDATGTSLGIMNGAKGKRSERDREGKGNNRNGAPKVGRPPSVNVKGERKTKTKLKQKTTQLSAVSKDERKTSLFPVRKDEHKLLENAEEEALDIPNTPISGMDDINGPVQDLDSWFNMDVDDPLQDEDFMGLQIPMDDIADVNMMV